MSYDFYLPCDPEAPTRVTLEDDGSLFFHDYDLETDLASEELGFGESVCLLAAREWESNPLEFLCRSRAIPDFDAARVACYWAETALDQEAAGLKVQGVYATSLQAVAKAERFFRGVRVRYGALLDLKRSLQGWLSLQPINFASCSLEEKRAVQAAIGCVDAVSDVHRQRQAFGTVTEPIAELCEVASNVLEQKLGVETRNVTLWFESDEARDRFSVDIAAAKADLVGEAIDKLTEIQERER